LAEIEKLQEWSAQRALNVATDFKRYLWTEIDWRNRLILIAGARGVGKTTMLLQYLKEQLPVGGASLYVSLDHLFFTQHTLVDLAEAFVQRGGRYLLLDEAHKYPGWSREVKIIYDQFQELQLVVSGSSAIGLFQGEGDLSRRARVYKLHGMSFREYLQFANGTAFAPVALEEVLDRPTSITSEIVSRIRPIRHFQDYLRYGYYPFSRVDLGGYHEQLRNIQNVVIESDIPAVYQVDYSATQKIKKLLGLLAEMRPFKPNIQKLSEQVGLSRETLIKYLQYLEKADVLQLLYSQAKGVSQLNKPEKIYLNNPNLVWAFGDSSAVNTGSLRETFFLNQTGVRHQVRYPRQGDFIVDDRYTFEVGGAGKGTDQVRNNPDAWVAADDVEIGVGKRIPLWLFGFLY